jgi:hypothetical protein
MFKETIFDGYKSPLNSNSVFVIILYLINIKPFICFKHTKKLYSLSKKNFIQEIVVIILLKTNSINSVNRVCQIILFKKSRTSILIKITPF